MICSRFLFFALWCSGSCPVPSCTLIAWTAPKASHLKANHPHFLYFGRPKFRKFHTFRVSFCCRLSSDHCCLWGKRGKRGSLHFPHFPRFHLRRPVCQTRTIRPTGLVLTGIRCNGLLLLCISPICPGEALVAGCPTLAGHASRCRGPEQAMCLVGGTLASNNLSLLW